ncbi:hypothetical protein AB0D67_01280 [Streptosporangium sp. NPDC048047]|uniref:hypothetical protein n=1 Tax=Streptosporangium sp. NPDC048047 TaxID=3155748 RepID=UPI00344A3F1C
MDELERVRELYGEPQAGPFAEARVRARLDAAIGAGAEGEAGARSGIGAGSGSRRPRPPWAMAVAGLAVAVAAATAVIAVPVTSGVPGSGGPGSGGPGSGGTSGGPGTGAAGLSGLSGLSGRSILLAAATSAESGAGAEAGAGTTAAGAYWHVAKLRRRTLPEPLGDGPDRYRVVEWRLTELWAARDGRAWTASRALGVRPAGEADEAAWRRDGSPSEWRNGPAGLSTSPGEGELTEITGEAPFSMAGHGMTLRRIEGLPSDPRALRDLVAGTVAEPPAPGTPAPGTPAPGTTDPDTTDHGTTGGDGTVPDGTAGSGDTTGEAGMAHGTHRTGRAGRAAVDGGLVADALSGLLWSKPSPPAVRAAAYRALAESPDVRYLGRAADARGRAGEAFSFTVRTPVPFRRTLVIDPGTSQVLSSTTSGRPGAAGDEVEVVLEAGWTDDGPAVTPVSRLPRVPWPS